MVHRNVDSRCSVVMVSVLRIYSVVIDVSSSVMKVNVDNVLNKYPDSVYVVIRLFRLIVTSNMQSVLSSVITNSNVDIVVIEIVMIRSVLYSQMI